MMWLCVLSLLTMASNLTNIALNRPYTMQPQPNYRYCTDPDDRIQLTDGQYAKGGRFWTQRETVGWQNVSPVIITVDLGRDAPIKGVSFNTAAGTAGVQFPVAIWVLVSADGKQWYEAGELVTVSNAQNGPPPTQGYVVHKFWTDRFKAHGRYVSFVVIPQGPFCFVDEVEVYEGDKEWLKEPMAGNAYTDPKTFAQHKEVERCALRRFHSDMEKLKQLIEQASVSNKANLLEQLEKLRKAIPTSFTVDEPKAFKAILPLNEWHKDLFRVQARLWASTGVPEIAVFVARSPYDPIPYLTLNPIPDEPLKAVKLVMLRGEVRHVAINIVNARQRPIKVVAEVEGLKGVDTKIHHAVWTDTKEGVPIAAALPEGNETSVESGMVGQIWLTLSPKRGIANGDARGHLRLRTDAGDKFDVELAITILQLDLPERQSLHVGGWDYTDVDERYGVNPKNRDAFISHIRERFVDIPWASRFVMPSGKFDEAGHMIEPPETTNFDRWLERWKGASRFYVFLSVGNSFEGSKVGTEEFERKVGEWIKFWWEHARERGLKEGQFGVLLVDEPHTPEQDELTIAWAKAIKRAAPEVVIWVDPTWYEPSKMNERLPEVVDVMCPNRIIWVRNQKEHDQFYLAWRDKGKRLASYSCSGPSKLLDPYAYYRLQAWHCFRIGADEMFFWAFGDNAFNSCWNAYLDQRNCYTPLFLAPDSVTPAKHMEAIRDGVQDYEILKMLKEALDRHKGKSKGETVAMAEALLTDWVNKVLEPIGEKEILWTAEKDRTIADTVREMALILLAKLSKL
ncbi:MAG: hypothetical protein HZRFUVUK_000420 [Candidatus Fervidibacterota bacterium]